MKAVLDFLQTILPLQVLALALFFFYLLFLFKKIAERFVKIAEEERTAARNQAEYVQERLNTLEGFIGISDKVVALRDKHIEQLEKETSSLADQLEVAEENLSQARAELESIEQDLEAEPQLTRQNLRNAQSRLEQALTAKHDALLAHLAHDLMAPLSAIMNRAHYLTRTSDKMDRISLTKKLISIQADAAEAKMLTKQIYHASDSSARTELASSVEVAARLKELEVLMRPIASGASRKMPHIRLEDFFEWPRFSVPPTAFDQIIANLLKNMIDQAQGSKAQVLGERSPGTYKIVFQDWGPGIDESESSKVFQPGFRSRRLTSVHGTGLGLYVAKKLTESLGGNLSLSSCENPTQFEVLLPHELSEPENAA